MRHYYCILILIIYVCLANGEDDIEGTPKVVGVVVQGRVFCQDCARLESWSMNGATPLGEARVAIACRDHRHRQFYYKVVRTDEWGFFNQPLKGLDVGRYHIDTPAHACAAHLLHSNSPNCNVATDTNFGNGGSPLRYEITLFNGTKYESDVYSAGPMAFRPKNCPWPTPKNKNIHRLSDSS
ncbi:hypothetical protein ZOSMA_175G00470 [Zostera marina]|uniref:Pollen Ole e 1 allergen and extensin family protein n=1 Tax=Zostera marina TaxID=29655 RepID=A0A0K9PRW0_ZOSMR|nr:hypothetical protein ZOSMA_175G00470 [Zostera marina]